MSEDIGAEERTVDVLLVEDTPSDAELTLRVFKKHKLANTVMWVKDGAEALEFLFCKGKYARRSSGNPRLILLDLKMPKVSGLDVLKEIKPNSITKSIPVVVMTSSAEMPDVTKAYDLGANSYIVKPVEYDNYAKVVEKLGIYWIDTNKPAGT